MLESSQVTSHRGLESSRVESHKVVLSADYALLLLVDGDAILLASYKINKPETGPDA